MGVEPDEIEQEYTRKGWFNALCWQPISSKRVFLTEMGGVHVKFHSCGYLESTYKVLSRKSIHDVSYYTRMRQHDGWRYNNNYSVLEEFNFEIF